MKKLIALVVLSVFLLSGCGVALLTAASAYAVSSIGKKNTEQKEAYDKYKLEMEKLNIERQKAKMEPLPIKTFDEWLGKTPKAKEPPEKKEVETATWGGE